MPEIGRFFGSDPIAEQFFSITNYQIAHNNPVWKIEFEGLEGLTPNGSDAEHHEPVKVIDNTGAAFKGNKGFKEVKVVQEATKKQLKRKLISEGIKGPLRFIAPLARIGLTNASIFLTPATANAPNLSQEELDRRVSQIDEKFQVDDRHVDVEGESDSPIQRLESSRSDEAFGPELGGGAVPLSGSMNSRIQAIADKYGLIITLVGSQADGSADENSDFDYFIEGGNSRGRSSALRALPRNPRANKEGEMRPGSERLTGEKVDEDRPFIRFTPQI